MNKKLDKLIKEYVNREDKIKAILDDLYGTGDYCTCNGRVEFISMVDEDRYNGELSVIKRCLTCGGYL